MPSRWHFPHFVNYGCGQDNLKDTKTAEILVKGASNFPRRLASAAKGQE